jgi:DNA-binding transcriptional regulator YhcF (GntR family)
MFKKSQTLRTVITEDERIYLADSIIQYVENNPYKKIPCKKLGKQSGIDGHVISQLVRELVNKGFLKRASQYTYVIPTDKADVPESKVEDTIAITIERLAKEYVWEAPNPTLKGFIGWLKK